MSWEGHWTRHRGHGKRGGRGPRLRRCGEERGTGAVLAPAIEAGAGLRGEGGGVAGSQVARGGTACTARGEMGAVDLIVEYLLCAQKYEGSKGGFDFGKRHNQNLHVWQLTVDYRHSCLCASLLAEVPVYSRCQDGNCAAFAKLHSFDNSIQIEEAESLS